MSRFTTLFAASVVLAATSPPSAAQVFQVTAPPIQGAHSAEVVTLSSDGTAAVGHFMLNGRRRPFRWTAEDGSVHIAADIAASDWLETTGCSGAGLVVVGFGEIGGVLSPWRWTPETGIRPMIPGGGIVVPFGVSEDGLAVTGYLFGANQVQSFRWNESFGIQPLPSPPGTNPMAFDISADGSTAAGTLNEAGTRGYPKT